MKRFFIVLVIVLLSTSRAGATVILSRLFSDHMVLQRDMQTTIWGRATPNASVTVSVGILRTTSTVDGNGDWVAKLPRLAPGGPYVIKVESRRTAVTIRDVMVGDVWLAAGQSNMSAPLAYNRLDPENGNTIAAANDSNLRIFMLVRNPNTPDAYAGDWSVINPQSAPFLSATAYYFGRTIRRAITVPLGIIVSAFPSTIGETWISKADYALHPEFFPLVNQQMAASEPGNLITVTPGTMFDSMIAPVSRYKLRGFLWYQGESNITPLGHGVQYGTLLRTLIGSWRSLWNEGMLPFVMAQISTVGDTGSSPAEAALVREGQMKVATSVPETALAVTFDVGRDDGDIHPFKKAEIGRRLALAALAISYHKRVVWSGPIFTRAEFRQNVILHFNNVEKGLMAVGGPLKDLPLPEMTVNG